MRTLFAENILSPSPIAVPPPDAFELHFPPSIATSSTASTQSSPRQHDWLTQQQTRRTDDDISRQSSHHGDHRPHHRRKGNPKMLFMGLRRAGKSSIQKVVFQKLSPADTLFLDGTSKIEHASMQSFITIDSDEIPSNLPLASADFDHAPIFSEAGAVVWVLDVQDEYLRSINEAIATAVFLAENYPRINFEVFIHKTDSLSDEYRHDAFREVRQRVQDELADLGHGSRSVSYYQTSIFDHSIFESMSKVVQKLLPQLPAMETLLNKLCSTCRIQKAYLFDTVSKIYVATDASPTFLRDYEVCSDYVDVIVDIKQIYGWQHGQGSQSSSDSKSDEGEIGESLISYDKGGDTYIYARQINDYLSLLCVMGKGSSNDKRLLIDYNVGILHDALLQVFKV